MLNILKGLRGNAEDGIASSAKTYKVSGTFGKYEVGKYGNVIGNSNTGMAYEAFRDHEGEYVYKRNAKADCVTVLVDPHIVEGIDKVQSPKFHNVPYNADHDEKAFWAMKKHSHEDYLDLASNLKDINSKIDGKTEEEQREIFQSIKNDPKYQKATSLYYGNGKVQVDQYDGGYILQGDGRHRVLAARESMDNARREAELTREPFDESKYYIPVQVIGSYSMRNEEEQGHSNSETLKKEQRIPDWESNEQSNPYEINTNDIMVGNANMENQNEGKLAYSDYDWDNGVSDYDRGVVACRSRGGNTKETEPVPLDEIPMSREDYAHYHDHYMNEGTLRSRETQRGLGESAVNMGNALRANDEQSYYDARQKYLDREWNTRNESPTYNPEIRNMGEGKEHILTENNDEMWQPSEHYVNPSNENRENTDRSPEINNRESQNEHYKARPNNNAHQNENSEQNEPSEDYSISM